MPRSEITECSKLMKGCCTERQKEKRKNGLLRHCRSVLWCEEMRRNFFKDGKVVKGEGLQVLEEINTLDSDQGEVYKFLGCEQTEKTDVKIVMERGKMKGQKKIKTISWNKPERRELGKSDKLLNTS